MALTINPTVSGSRTKFLSDAGAFMVGVYLGALVSALIVVALLVVVTAVLSEIWAVSLALAAIAWAVLHDVGVPVRLPYRRGQVPEWFREALPHGVVAALFGVQLGTGFLTFFTYSTQLAMLLFIPFLNGLADILVVLGVFAIGKTLVLLSALGTTSVDQVTTRFSWTPAGQRVLRLTTAATSVLVGFAIAGMDLTL